MLEKIKRLISFAPYFLIPALGAGSPLLVIPALTHTYGAGGWAAIAIGQSIGATLGVIADFGWNILGPQRIAGADAGTRRQLYMAAYASKLATVALFVPVAALLAFVLSSDHKAASALLASAICATALSPSWYFVGCNRPLTILWTESVPRLLFSMIAGVAIYLGGPLECYGAASLASILLTVFLSARMLELPIWPEIASFVKGIVEIRKQWAITFGRTVSVIYTALPISLVSIVNPDSVAAFAASDRLMRMALSILAGVPNRLQSWVGSAPKLEILERSKKSLIYNVVLGIPSGLGFFLLAPFVSSYIFSNAVHISLLNAMLSGTMLATICATRGYGLSLIVESRSSWIVVANICAAVLGLGGVLVFSKLWGSPGAILGGLIAEAVGLGIQAFALHRSRRRETAVQL